MYVLTITILRCLPDSYDALLGAAGDWRELCLRGMLHGGDSDSTGVIAGACYGAMHGFKGVPEGHYQVKLL